MSFRENKIITVLVFILIVIGFWFRIKGLFIWPLALDEYYIARSVQNIVTKGFPEFDAGGYYVRALIYQYLSAGLSLTGIKIEYAVKIVPVLFSFFAIFPLYKISKYFLNKNASWFIVFLYLFSLWEVEFTRFARMYVPFQTIFLWYLYFLFRYLFDGLWKARYWLLVLSFLSVFVYEASIFLALLNFIIIVWDKDKNEFDFSYATKFLKQNLNYIILAVLIIGVVVLMVSYDFRSLYSNDLLPPELKDYFAEIKKNSRLRLPTILVFSKPVNALWYLLYLLQFSILTFGFVKISKFTNIQTSSKSYLLVVLFFALLNLYGLIIFLSFIFLLINNRLFNNIEKKQFLFLLFLLLISFAFWNIFALFNNDWFSTSLYSARINNLGQLKVFWKESLNYPYIYESVVLFRDTLPNLTYVGNFFILLGILTVIWGKVERRNKQGIFYSLFLLLILGITFIKTGFFDTRYFFFLLPVYYLLIYLSAKNIVYALIRKANYSINVATIFILIIFVSTEDFSINHLLNIDSVEINFRKGFDKNIRNHFYPRWDSRSVAEVVNKEAKPNDIIISDEQISQYYLKRLDYRYRDYRDADFENESVDNGKKERWTNANLIYTYENLLKKISDPNHRKWLIINKTWKVFREEEDVFFKKINPYLYYSSEDGTTFLYKITKNINFLE